MPPPAPGGATSPARGEGLPGVGVGDYRGLRAAAPVAPARPVVSDQLGDLLPARDGHFRFESGHHGDLWLELDLLHLRPALVRPFAAELGRRLSAHRVEAVCGPLTGGAYLALAVALDLEIAFCATEGSAAPGAEGLFPVEYRLPAALWPALTGRRVAVVDDVVNAGSAAGGTVAALRRAGAVPVALGALLVLGAGAAALAAREGLALERLAERPANLWTPAECPLCAAGVALDAGVRPPPAARP